MVSLGEMCKGGVKRDRARGREGIGVNVFYNILKRFACHETACAQKQTYKQKAVR